LLRQFIVDLQKKPRFLNTNPAAPSFPGYGESLRYAIALEVAEQIVPLAKITIQTASFKKTDKFIHWNFPKALSPLHLVGY
jgi:hypothetical protein